MRLPPGDRCAAAGARLEYGVQLAHGEQDRPAVQHGGHLVHPVHRVEALLQQQLEEFVAPAAVRARPGDRAGRFDDEGRVELVVDQDEAAGDPEDGLVGGEALGLRRAAGVLAAGDAAYGALQLLLGDLDDLRGDARRVGEGEDGGFVTDEEHRAGAFLLGVAGGAAGSAVVTARGIVADEQPVGFGVADLGAYVLADVEHARHGVAPRTRCVRRAVPGSWK